MQSHTATVAKKATVAVFGDCRQCGHVFKRDSWWVV